MAIKKFFVQLTVAGIDSHERMMAIRGAVQNAGRLLHAQTLLICGDGPSPKVELFGEDLTEGRDDISLEEDE